MKCFYAIPAASSAEAEALCAAYARSLETLSGATLTLADDTRAFAESTGAAVLKLDEEDWLTAKHALEVGGVGALAGELYWDAGAVRQAVAALSGEPTAAVRTVASWLDGQLARNRSAVLLAS